MKAHRLPTVSIRAAVTLSFLSTLLLLGSAVQVGAQCKTPIVHTNRAFGWKTGVTVQVNIDPAYNTDQRNALAAAFTNWNNVKDTVCPNVTFGTPTYSPTPIAGPNIGGNASTPKFQVYKQDPPDGSGDRDSPRAQ